MVLYLTWVTTDQRKCQHCTAHRKVAPSMAAAAQAIESATAGFGPWALTATFCALVLVATTFISHTVGAIVILPIVGAVGAQMEVRGRFRVYLIP